MGNADRLLVSGKAANAGAWFDLPVNWTMCPRSAAKRGLRSILCLVSHNVDNDNPIHGVTIYRIREFSEGVKSYEGLRSSNTLYLWRTCGSLCGCGNDTIGCHKDTITNQRNVYR